MSVLLHGYSFSVYLRVARMSLAEKGVAYRHREVDPFGPLPEGYLDLHPFGRVPVLEHDGFTLYETQAITRYVDLAFPGPTLQPEGPRARARMAQVIAMVDAYAYWPLVRQVYAHRVFRPAEGAAHDEVQVALGLGAAGPVLAALERVAGEGLVLDGVGLTLADLHLAPMIAAFTMVPEGAEALARHPALSLWWAAMSERDSLKDTDPGLPG